MPDHLSKNETSVNGANGPTFDSTSEEQEAHPIHNANAKLARTVSRRRGVDKTWVVRPSAEDVLENLEEYFPGHDVDKEIIEMLGQTLQGDNATSSASSAAPNHKLGRGKSIRIAAQQNLERERIISFSAAAKGIQAINKLKRKTTKIWNRPTEQIKPGQEVQITAAQKEAPMVSWVRGHLVGKGTFGKVYLALNLSNSEIIAVKQVELPKTASDFLSERQKTVVKSFYDEMELLKDLDHEHIVQYLGYEKTEDTLNIFLEYVNGGSIGTCLKINGKFKEPVVRSFTRQILLGLEYLHDKNILHRDIKADNILVDEDGCCKISDFGISKRNDHAQPYDNMSNMSLQGTIFWMAPEVFSHGYSAKVDIWSLGCVVLEMFTAQRPWQPLDEIAAMFKLGSEKKPPPIGKEIKSKEALDFMNQCFITNPDERPTAATLLLSDPFIAEDPNFQFKKFIKVPRPIKSRSQ